ncbi:MAG: ABC transporter permease [Chelatococcus sp.]|jgi:ribose transport system permease protein|uniref:ABC transporter permease n=1 Tax=unclassified Chelatococcus TaxID=2638111 RepID=UPI001BCFCACA|nr:MULTISPECIES: ABC transporter permease [unclassified Chelatococcus]CAH1671455.1 ribose ABC transporter membrane subunit [Hyphomicrobiales bacterium]MBS7739076.1 ABC transporter permease [Chelatococcus sp. HY11]MBX3540031.1 ABC transporter permease [Chelatococcus sp.]MBX3543511.1 ABC transporter permease [Chelatococcus sp.]MCO5076394.1 ABC transporter permease [Chelatococcus sp.]
MQSYGERLQVFGREEWKAGLGRIARERAMEIALPVATLGLVIVFSLLSDVFLTGSNFRNIGIAAAALAAVAFGQTFVILTAGLDLSVGSTVALVSVVLAFVMREFGIVPGIVAALLCGALVGIVNGLIITRFRISAFITTLAMLSVTAGLALNLAGGVPILGLPPAFGRIAYQYWLGLPIPVLLAAVTLIIAELTLRYTRLGRHICAVGGNEEAARLSGIHVERVRVIAYAICGLTAAIGAIILTARVSSGQPTLGATLPLESIAAVVLGGVSLAGGRGSIVNVAFGVAFISILANGLNLLNISSYTQMMIIGLSLIAAVALDQANVRRKQGH